MLVADDGSVGVLDFDLIAVGDPALDLANLLVHLDLRSREGIVPDVSPLREAVLRGYGATYAMADRLRGYDCSGPFDVVGHAPTPRQACGRRMHARRPSFENS